MPSEEGVRSTVATSTANPPETTEFVSQEVPALENGDRLTREEFERRYDAMPDLKKAELIEGIVYMGSPVNHERHGKPHFRLIGWLDRYVTATPGVDGGDNSSLRLDLDNMPQPDALLYILPASGGRVRIPADEYMEGAPELIAEVASSSVSYDLHDKLQVYRRNGVNEYLVWRILDRAIDWFVLRGGAYERLSPEEGICRSATFPGLWLDAAALIRGDRAAVAQALERGLATPEHEAFAAGLRARAATAAGPTPP
jgi:Uma2 family endonuclease